jgi:rhodanese-related sulfurtransferase
MVIREAFAVYCRDDASDSLNDMTVGILADRAHLPVEGVMQRLNRIESMAENVEVSCEELDRLIKAKTKGVFLLDVRQGWEFDLCHLEGSTLMAKVDLAQIFPGLKEMDVITICHHGVSSLSAAFYLREAGLPRVRSLHGGLDEWALTVDKAMARY